MSVPSLAHAPLRRPARILWRCLGVLVLLAIVTAIGIAAWFYFSARASLPQVDGTVPLPGLSQRVRVLRDVRGVPHIIASNMDDLLFAQGYATAQDRLWQMDMSRRSAAGELAEVLGPAGLEHDQQQRILLMRLTAERMVAALDTRNREYLDAYTRGVNAFMASHFDRLPIEFRVLRYQPRPWRATDSLGIGLQMSELLNLRLRDAVRDNEKLRAKLPPELAADLFPTSSGRDHPPGEDEAAAPDAPDSSHHDDEEDGDELERKARAVLSQKVPEIASKQISQQPLVPGSNNWVVSGARTVSGKPLLSNDMHLPLGIPNTWYEAQLEIREETNAAPLFDVAGFTLPGVPFVIVGHNQRIAWGFTNLEPQVTDLYVETFNEGGQYKTPAGWKSPEVQHELIHVKGAPDVPLDVVITRHGPIITQLVPGAIRKLALKWIVYEPSTMLLPFADVNAAQNWDEFRRALSHFDSPAQNVVYADIDGHIGYQATGKIPIRVRDVTSSPVPGNDDTHEWTGYIPFEKLPEVFDPPSGILATANNRIVPKRYSYTLTNDWSAPYRVQRIYQVLQSGKKFAPADMLDLQTDVMSDFDHFCAERFVYAIDHVKNASPRARAAADILRGWDGQMSRNAAAPVIETLARQNLWRRLLESKLGPDYKEYSWGMNMVALENILAHAPARWLAKEYSSFDELLARAIEDVVKQPASPQNLNSWRWGKEHPFYLQHPVFGAIPLLNRWSGPGLKEQSGSGLTVKQVGRTFGASERMTVDLADLDNSTSNLVTGESGQIFSEHYMDQFASWFGQHTFVFPFTEAAVARAKKHELGLEKK